eukprot:TRINITY_DN13752_c0_g1_i2.p1 TRINITY_DN13752_c0_g1~~TRINITY_DN13752_c0_g1_i2.p1  ORF type:complete len:766 (+),score=116.67 TRINITY_DN13752_c0_g1_i2:117-2414(+)
MVEFGQCCQSLFFADRCGSSIVARPPCYAYGIKAKEFSWVATRHRAARLRALLGICAVAVTFIMAISGFKIAVAQTVVLSCPSRVLAADSLAPPWPFPVVGTTSVPLHFILPTLPAINGKTLEVNNGASRSEQFADTAHRVTDGVAMILQSALEVHMQSVGEDGAKKVFLDRLPDRQLFSRLLQVSIGAGQAEHLENWVTWAQDAGMDFGSTYETVIQSLLRHNTSASTKAALRWFDRLLENYASTHDRHHICGIMCTFAAADPRLVDDDKIWSLFQKLTLALNLTAADYSARSIAARGHARCKDSRGMQRWLDWISAAGVSSTAVRMLERRMAKKIMQAHKSQYLHVQPNRRDESYRIPHQEAVLSTIHSTQATQHVIQRNGVRNGIHSNTKLNQHANSGERLYNSAGRRDRLVQVHDENGIEHQNQSMSKLAANSERRAISGGRRHGRAGRRDRLLQLDDDHGIDHSGQFRYIRKSKRLKQRAQAAASKAIEQRESSKNAVAEPRPETSAEREEAKRLNEERKENATKEAETLLENALSLPDVDFEQAKAIMKQSAETNLTISLTLWHAFMDSLRSNGEEVKAWHEHFKWNMPLLCSREDYHSALNITSGAGDVKHIAVLFDKMIHLGHEPSEETYAFVFSTCVEAGTDSRNAIKTAEKFFYAMVATDITPQASTIAAFDRVVGQQRRSVVCHSLGRRDLAEQQISGERGIQELHPKHEGSKFPPTRRAASVGDIQADTHKAKTSAVPRQIRRNKYGRVKDPG